MSPLNCTRKTHLKVKYPSLCERLIRDYKNADNASINRSIEIFDWGNSFEGKNVHELVHFFNKTTLNIFLYSYIPINYIPNKAILCNDKDRLWFNHEIRKILRKMRYSNSM